MHTHACTHTQSLTSPNLLDRATDIPENKGTGIMEANQDFKILLPYTYRAVLYESLQLLISIN